MDISEREKKTLEAARKIEVVEPTALEVLAEQMRKKGATIFNPDIFARLGSLLPKETLLSDVLPITQQADAIKGKK